MSKSKVYFTDMRTTFQENLPQKLRRLIDTAGLGTLDFNKKYVAIKIHFGEPGNLSFLRPNFAKTVADTVKRLGGIPFLTDCSTLYTGRRKNAIEHLYAAQENGFNPTTCGCQIIIGDGIRGTDEALVPLAGTKLVTEAKIGRAIMDADVFISLSHFKGHEQAGFGGAIKNIGMGCASRAGKMEQHCDGKPEVNPKRCRGCRACARQCAHDAISFDADGKASIDHKKCVGCGRCIEACPMGLEPVVIAQDFANKDFAALKARCVDLCVACGSCTYACPAKRPVSQTMGLAKGWYMAELRKGGK